jgi:hypothetical protein
MALERYNIIIELAYALLLMQFEGGYLSFVGLISFDD